MSNTHPITGERLQAGFFRSLLNDLDLTIPAATRAAVQRSRDYLDSRIARTTDPIYGITTGFGSLYDRTIPADQLEQLQENLVTSHACGTGPQVPEEIVRLMLFLKIQSLSYGHSGVQPETIDLLMDMFNARAYPVVYEFGSLGASGDLAPLAHLCLPLLGKGAVIMKGERIDGSAFLASRGQHPLRLQSKEGLALLNGTQFMSAYGIWCAVHAQRLLTIANMVGALSLDAFDGRRDAFDPLVHAIRPHPGQISTAKEVLGYLEGSELQQRRKQHVQDPYSFRCIPQVHGATSDTIEHVIRVLETEINSVTDNPLLFPDEDTIISGGNFHGQPLALAMDFLAIALAELGNISERRTFQLISGARHLPSYLVTKPGLNSGMMILQYTAAGIVSRNKQLCTPASVDSIVSSNGQEDHVSMGANAATRTRQVVENLYSILGIELLVAAQALEFRRPSKSSPTLEKLVSNFRNEVTFLQQDRVLHDDMVAAEQFLKKTFA